MKSEIMKNKVNDNRKYLIRFVTSYSILLIFVLIMGMILYQFGIRDAKNKIHNQNKTMLENAVGDLDSSLSMMSTLVTQYSNDTSMRSLVKYTNINSLDFYHTAQDAMHLLTNHIPLETTLPIDSYYIYLPNLNYIMSNSMLTDFRLYYQYDKAYEMSYYNDFMADLMGLKDTYQLLPLNQISTNNMDSFLYKVPMYTSLLSGEPTAMVCFEINHPKLDNTFDNLDLFDHGFLYVVNEQNDEVFRITAGNTSSAAIEQLSSSLDSADFNNALTGKELKLDSDSMVVTTAQSSENGWTFYLVQPAELTFHELISYQNTYSVIIVLTCVFSLLVIFLLSMHNVKPIAAMNTQLELSEEETLNLRTETHNLKEETHNLKAETNILREEAISLKEETHALRAEAVSLKAKTHTLREKLEAQRPIIYNSYLAKMMKGLISTKEEADMISHELCLSDDDKYTVLYACLYQDQLEFYLEKNTDYTESKDVHSDYIHTLRSYFHKYFGEDALIYEVEANAFAIMLSRSKEETGSESCSRIKEAFEQLHEHIMNEYSIWLFGGLGKGTDQIDLLWKSYQQAVQAASFIREGNVFQSFAEIKRDKTTYYYPFEMAQQLSNFITTGNQKQIEEIFRLIRRENFEDRSLPVTIIRWLLSDVRNTLLKVRFTITANAENTALLDSIDLAFHENKSIETLEMISIKLCSLFEHKVEGNKLIASIQAYIKENYQDSSLSLKMISENFDISESYFSYLFKAETKQNFSEYLEMIRMEQAMYLLKNSDMNISDMYLALGYNNPNSFRRVFKKVYGVSPKAIRETMVLECSVE